MLPPDRISRSRAASRLCAGGTRVLLSLQSNFDDWKTLCKANHSNGQEPPVSHVVRRAVTCCTGFVDLIGEQNSQVRYNASKITTVKHLSSIPPFRPQCVLWVYCYSSLRRTFAGRHNGAGRTPNSMRWTTRGGTRTGTTPSASRPTLRPATSGSATASPDARTLPTSFVLCVRPRPVSSEVVCSLSRCFNCHRRHSMMSRPLIRQRVLEAWTPVSASSRSRVGQRYAFIDLTHEHLTPTCDYIESWRRLRPRVFAAEAHCKPPRLAYVYLFRCIVCRVADGTA